MASERSRLAPTRRSRRLAGLPPTPSSTGDGMSGQMADGSDDVMQEIPVDGRPSPVRRFSDPTFGETLPVSASSAGRHSASSTTSPTRSAAADPVAGPSSAASAAERSNVTALSVGSPGGLRSRGNIT